MSKSVTVKTDDVADLFSEGSGTIADAKIKFGIGRTTIYQWMSEGKLPYSTASGRRVIPWKALKRLLASEMVGVSSSV